MRTADNPPCGRTAQSWTRLDGYALVESLGGEAENGQRFIVDRFHNAFAVRNGLLVSICEHCAEGLESAALRSAVMNGFVHLGREGLLVNERLLIASTAAELTRFHNGTSMKDCELPFPDYALMLVCDSERAGETGIVELWHSIARNDYAVIVKGHEGLESLRTGLEDDLAGIVAMIGDLGLVLTQLHLAQTRSPYCALARDQLLKALGHAGYQFEHEE